MDGMTIEIDDSEILRLIAAGDREYETGAASGLTKIARHVKTRSARGTAKSLRLPTGVIRKRIFVQPARRQRLEAVVRAYLRPVNPGPVAKRNTAGASAYGRSFPGAFVAVGRGGSPLVLKRKPEAATSTGRDSKGRLRRGRLPVAAQKIEVYPKANEVIGKVTRRIDDAFINRTVAHEIWWRLERASR